MLTKRTLPAGALIFGLGCARGVTIPETEETDPPPDVSAEGGGGSGDATPSASATTGGEALGGGGSGTRGDRRCGDLPLEHEDPQSGHCYRLLAELPTTWHLAREACVSWGGDLVAIGSAAEQAFVSGLTGERTWIGLNDLGSEGAFEWSNGEPGGYLSFAEGQPDNDESLEHCVELVPSEGYAWNDLRCDWPLVAVCERE